MAERGQGRKITSATLAKFLLHIPLMTIEFFGDIHWEALKLWVKDARFRRSPPSPTTAPFRDEQDRLPSWSRPDRRHRRTP